MSAKTFTEIIKFNDMHDERGRFASKNGGATGTVIYSAVGEKEVAAMAAEMGQDKISSEDIEVLNKGYFGNLKFRDLNDALREGKQLSDDQQNVVEVADRNMKPSTKDIRVDRYMFGGLFQALGLNEKAIENGKDTEAQKATGKTITDKAYTSTTYDASQIPFPYLPNKTILMHIDVPKGTKMLVRPDHKEAEILLERDTSIKIKKVSKATSGIFEIDAEVVAKTIGKSTAMAKSFIEALHGNITESAQQFHIYKADEDKRLIFGWGSVAIRTDGKQIVDLQNDLIDPEDLEEAVYDYVLDFRNGGEEHIPRLRKKARLVESVVFTKEKMKAMGIPEGTVPEGWWLGFYVDDDEAWAKVKDGTYQMFSIEGQGVREEVKDDIGKAERINGCGIIVMRGNKILTATRIGGKHGNQIGGPGGHIEPGETHEEAAVRETMEEFGIQCKKLEPLGILDGGRNYGKSAVFLCTEYDGEPQTDEEEMTDLQWRTIEELEGERLFWPFEQSLSLIEEMSPEKRQTVAKTFEEILKFNPFHDAKGKFSSSKGFASYSANPKTKAGAMAISRSAQAGHGTTMNVHRESQGENINQNYSWLNGGPGAKQLSAQGQLASQQPKKPQKNYDSRGFADQDDADYHKLYAGKQYYQQQNLSAAEKKAVDNYLENYTEPGSLYSHSQNLNYQMVQGQKLTGKYKQTYDGMMSSMHNIGYNVELTRYDHADMVNGLLKATGAGTNYENMSINAIKKALVGATVNENKFLSASYNDFANAPSSSKKVFDSRAVKINYKVKADVQAMMPGKGGGGDLGEIVLAPTNGTANRGGRITDVRLTGQMVRRKGTQMYNQPRIEIDIEI